MNVLTSEEYAAIKAKGNELDMITGSTNGTELLLRAMGNPTLPISRALCKFRGMLVIAEVSINPGGGSCPECGSTDFFERHGWLECDCGFAYLKSDVERITCG